jgi:hypothetical protein
MARKSGSNFSNVRVPRVDELDLRSVARLKESIECRIERRLDGGVDRILAGREGRRRSKRKREERADGPGSVSQCHILSRK